MSVIVCTCVFSCMYAHAHMQIGKCVMFITRNTCRVYTQCSSCSQGTHELSLIVYCVYSDPWSYVESHIAQRSQKMPFLNACSLESIVISLLCNEQRRRRLYNMRFKQLLLYIPVLRIVFVNRDLDPAPTVYI